MNDLEKSTYCEPNFNVINDALDDASDVTKTDKNKINNKCKNETLDDDEIAHLGECF